ncbi:MAG: sulfotransferase [Gammaproteobacteria bacterium]|nr:sulfotransferase [Gammaproteobacteria bacterium]
MSDSADRRQLWQPPRCPEWVERINAEGDAMDIASVVPLDADSLIASAMRATALGEFGAPDWEEPFRVLTRALDEEAELSLLGRLMTRSDLLVFLQNRLRIEESYRLHPEIEDEQIHEPVFIVGLPRSGTSILFELLAHDAGFAIPETWMLLFSCPPPGVDAAGIDARVARAHHLVTQWNRVVPEYASMHEMGGRIPSECGMLMANSFISDHLAALHQTPSYDRYLAGCSWEPAYRYHRRMLKLLQWRSPRRRWLLKAPNHLGHLPLLLATYPDARIVHTHRDPLKCMASATNLLGCLLWMRSRKPFDSTAFEDVILGEATASRLDNVMRQRDAGLIPAERIVDSVYQELMDDPLATVTRLYAGLDLELDEATLQAMQDYLAAKPKGKHGVHRYQAADAQTRVRERALFRAYQLRHGVPDES